MIKVINEKKEEENKTYEVRKRYPEKYQIWLIKKP